MGQRVFRFLDLPTVAKAKAEETTKPQPIVVQIEGGKGCRAAKRQTDFWTFIGNNLNIIRPNEANEMEINRHAVPDTDFDLLYAKLFSPQGNVTFAFNDRADRCAKAAQRRKQGRRVSPDPGCI